MPEFLKGLTLSQHFFEQVISPLMARFFPDMPYAAGLVGPGSDVQGFDTEISSDHDWGPRIYLFPESSETGVVERVKKAIDAHLPAEFMGWPVLYWRGDDGVSVRDDLGGESHSLVKVFTPAEWLLNLTGLSSLPPTRGQWLRMPDQVLREATGGAIFRDDTGDVTSIRASLAFYPDEIWIYRMISLWSEISEENQFTGRTGDLNDDIGSRIVAGRQATRMMRLAFLLSRQYAPYIKWFGTAFMRLQNTGDLNQSIREMLVADAWPARVQAHGRALDALLDMHDALGITPAIPRNSAPYRQQYLTRDVAPVVDALRLLVPEPFPSLPTLGNISDFMLNTPAQSGSDAAALQKWLKIQ